MGKGKEFYEHCTAHPEVMGKLQSMKSDEVPEFLQSLGFELTAADLREFMELCAESNDEQLANAVSGGSCNGHCGKTCESDVCGDGHCGFTCEHDGCGHKCENESHWG